MKIKIAIMEILAIIFALAMFFGMVTMTLVVFGYFYIKMPIIIIVTIVSGIIMTIFKVKSEILKEKTDI